MTSDPAAIAPTAARLVVEEGLEYAAAKRRAIKELDLPARTPLPDNDVLEEAVREHIALFCADTQPRELAALRELALLWMQRLQAFEPLVGGAVWRGTATRLNDVYLHLFADDAKAVEIALIDEGIDYEVSRVPGLHGQEVDALSIHAWCEGLQEEVGVHLLVNGPLAQRGSLAHDARGRPLRGTADRLQALLKADAPGRPSIE
ncbi:MAG: hypothetical protein Q4A11_07500 [Brachymonas sp.]|nr:hypothetical protein [Brachymonas sp.]